MKQTQLWSVLYSSCCIISAVRAFNDPVPQSLKLPQPPGPVMRAWTCHGRTQAELVDRLTQANIVQSPLVQSVMQAVDRANYVPNDPYMDAPQAIGQGQTISAPHMHAYALEALLPCLQQQKEHPEQQRDLRILDVGCGSGYLTACMGRWLHSRNPQEPPLLAKGQVYGIDIHADLVDQTRRNMQLGDADLLSSGTVQLSESNGWNGWPAAAPFDAIHVGAAAAEFPRTLASQLSVGGCMVVPIGPQGAAQHLYKVTRLRGHGDSQTDANLQAPSFVMEDFEVSQLLGVRYVPLVEGPKH